MPFNVLGFVFASALTQNLEDRQRASQLSLLGGLLGNSPVGLVLVASAAQQGAGDGGTDRSGGRPTRVAVPKIGEDVEQDERILTARGLKPTVVKITDDRPIDEVLGTDPEAGTIVAFGSTVAVEVSAGLVVPNVIGKKQQEGEALVGDAGFVPVVKKAEDPGAKGLVQKQQPTGGSFLSAGSEVVLFVVGAGIGDEDKAADRKKEPAASGTKT